MTTPFPGLVLPDGLDDVAVVDSAGSGNARVGVRRARASALADAYPAGTHDLELVIEGDPTVSALAAVTARVLERDPRCRRVVLPVRERDLDSIAWAEHAGFRYVVDVETRAGAFSLLVTEPGWVLAQPHILDDIPLKE
jgi:hypothetical protein